MAYKQKVDSIIAILLILIGIIMILLPTYINVKITIIIPIVFSLYTILNLIQFILTIKSKDKEGLLTSLTSAITMILSIFININEPKKLFMVLTFWIILMSLIKLKKADYYNDKRDRMWKLKILTLILFIITSLLTTINLMHDNTIIIIGYFMLIHGILELIDPIVKTLIKHS